MHEQEVSFVAALIEQFGIINVAYSIVIVAIALSIPTSLTYIKDSVKRKQENGLLNAVNELSSELRILARQYNESISLSAVENIMDNVLKNHCWTLYDFVREVIEKNDIHNEKDSIEHKIQMQVFQTFKAINNDLMKYKYKTKSLNEFIDQCEWEVQINQVVLNTIYDNKLNGIKRIHNSRTYLFSEFGNINYMALQTISRY